MINNFLRGLIKKDNCQQALSFSVMLTMRVRNGRNDRLLERLTQLRRMRNFKLLTCFQCEYIWLLFDIKPPNDINYRPFGALVTVMITSVHN
jgi:hypothetical protein